MYTRAGDLLCRPVLCCAARERRSLPSFRRRRFSGLPLSERWSLPGPAPAGGPTSCAPKKSAEEGRSRGLPPVPLRNPREYLASTRRLPSLPTGTLAEGSIQVADAPNDGNNGATSLPGRGTRGRILSPKGTLFKKSGPQGRVREADSSRGRGAERPRAAVARSALRAQPGQAAQAPCGFFPLFLGRPRNRAACRGGTRQATPLTERQI